MVKISVVMPTYNQSVPILKTATESILNQTFEDYEFIIIDDGSTNESRDYLSSLTDPRIRIIRNETNLGVTKSLNIGFEAAQGKYIARMDSDDYSYPDRFQKQYDFMESHPNVIVCGRSSASVRPPKFDFEKYRVKMLFVYPGPIHPSAFFNHEKLKQFDLIYDESLPYAQDYALWAEIVQYGDVYLFCDKLVDYRGSPNQISKRHREEQIKCDKVTQKKLLLNLLDHVTDEELDMHYRVSCLTDRISREERDWCHRLLRANNQKHIYSKQIFIKYVYKILIIRQFPVIQKVREIVAREIKKSKGLLTRGRI